MQTGKSRIGASISVGTKRRKLDQVLKTLKTPDWMAWNVGIRGIRTK